VKLQGTISFPGDKSISHRALMIGCLTNGNSTIKNVSTGRDVQTTIDCLRQCGISIDINKDDIVVHGGEFHDPTTKLDCGNSGTTTRLIAGLLIGKGIAAKLVGDESLSRRPMNRIVAPLQAMGGSIKATDGTLPITIFPSKIHGFQYTMPRVSAQVKSAILFAGLFGTRPSIIHELLPTRDHTERILKSLGVPIQSTGGSISINPISKPLPAFEISIAGDPSSAAFFAAAAALIPDSEITLKNIVKNPTRTGFFHVLQEMGGIVQWENETESCGEISGDVVIKTARLNGITIDERLVPSIIDEIPIIGLLATQAEGKTKISGAGELRVKESDRIRAMVSNLKSCGADIEELADGFIVQGPTPLKGVHVQTFGDHRIAMTFAIASLISSGTMYLDDDKCVDISFPEFYTKLHEICV